MRCIHLPDENASLHWAQKLSSCLPFSAMLAFSGDIGAGKTTFIRGLLQALGLCGPIKSPTFSLVESYSLEKSVENYSTRPLLIHHFDLYRIEDEEELHYIGFQDYLGQEALFCIEWPEHAQSIFPAIDVHFVLTEHACGRNLEIKALSVAGEKIVSLLVNS